MATVRVAVMTRLSRCGDGRCGRRHERATTAPVRGLHGGECARCFRHRRRTARRRTNPRLQCAPCVPKPRRLVLLGELVAHGERVEATLCRRAKWAHSLMVSFVVVVRRALRAVVGIGVVLLVVVGTTAELAVAAHRGQAPEEVEPRDARRDQIEHLGVTIGRRGERVGDAGRNDGKIACARQHHFIAHQQLQRTRHHIQQLGCRLMMMRRCALGARPDDRAVRGERVGRTDSFREQSHRRAARKLERFDVRGAHEHGTAFDSRGRAHGCLLKKPNSWSCIGAESATAISGPYTPWARISAIGTWR